MRAAHQFECLFQGVGTGDEIAIIAKSTSAPSTFPIIILTTSLSFPGDRLGTEFVPVAKNPNTA
jgi:hypothetical protein